MSIFVCRIVRKEDITIVFEKERDLYTKAIEILLLLDLPFLKG
jgi:hypothetical protein